MSDEITKRLDAIEKRNDDKNAYEGNSYELDLVIAALRRCLTDLDEECEAKCLADVKDILNGRSK